MSFWRDSNKHKPHLLGCFDDPPPPPTLPPLWRYACFSYCLCFFHNFSICFSSSFLFVCFTEGDPAGWTQEPTLQGHNYYHNRKTGAKQWERPEEFTGKSADLTRQEIQHILTRVTGDYNRQKLLEANEHVVIQLQARWRGILLRREFNQRMQYLRDQRPHIVKIQANLKRQLQRKKYLDRVNYLKANEKAVITVSDTLLL